MDRWTTLDHNFRTFLLVSQIEPDAIRARIREARRQAGLTQQDLADLIDRHKRTVENYENVRVPEWAELRKIAAALNKPIEWFLHGDQPGSGGELAELRDRLDRQHEQVLGRLDALEELMRSLVATRERV